MKSLPTITAPRRAARGNPARNSGNKRATRTLDWQLCEGEQEWENAQRKLAVAPDVALIQVTPAHQRWLLRHLPLVAALLFVLALGGWTIWQRAEAGIAQVESELQAEVAAEMWPAKQAAPRVAKTKGLHATEAYAQANVAALPHAPGESITHVAVRDLGQDWAVVDVTLQPAKAGPRYRQTRVYHESAYGWVRTDATAAAWGAPRHLETAHFVFDYHAVDEAAVAAAATQLDALYPALQRYARYTVPPVTAGIRQYEAYPIRQAIYGAQAAAEAKVHITVDPAQPPGLYAQDGKPTEEIIVASPAAALLPTDTAAGDVLAQALLLALYNRLSLEGFSLQRPPGQWLRINNAARLWMVWEHELPLAVWREPLVHWVLAQPEDAPRDPYHSPEFAHDLCAHHAIWLRSPLDVAVPVLCWQRSDGQSMTTAWRYHHRLADYSLNAMLYASAIDLNNAGVPQDMLLFEPGPYAIVLATVFEYVAETYGADRVPRLLATIPAHEHADTLIPAVLGVPLADVEQGWHAFLIDRYDLAQ